MCVCVFVSMIHVCAHVRAYVCIPHLLLTHLKNNIVTTSFQPA